jgi:mitogen-activated protein kinase kinase kinase
MLLRSLELKHEARPTAAELLEHAFIASRPATVVISDAQAQAAMAAAHASAQRGMAGMVQAKG